MPLRQTLKIQWAPCSLAEFGSGANPTNASLQCADIQVPLDYAQPDNKSTLGLHIVKFPASVQPSKGSILHNFGGPGQDARNTLVAYGPILQFMSGGQYDLLAFDPRGVNYTLPFNCTSNGFYMGEMTAESRSAKDYDTSLQRIWARSKVDAAICASQGNADVTGDLVGTAFTARDFMSVVDALGEDGMLRYWGFSYGTTLGATLAAMFPDKIDKLVIDGVQNAHEYYNSLADFQEWTQTDMIVGYFLETCLQAGPQQCALASINKTASELSKDLWGLFDSLRENPIPAGVNLVDANIIEGAVLGSLESTSEWSGLATILAALMYGNETTREATATALMLSAPPDSPATFNNTISLLGIHCADQIPRTNSFDSIRETVQQALNISKLAGDNTEPSRVAHCAVWPWQAKEIYRGDFRAKTKNPILLVTNTQDAHTPPISAFNMSSGFEGSSVLQLNGTGHTSLKNPNLCGAAKIAAYWVNGTLPQNGTVCPGAAPWSGYSWADVFKLTPPS